MKKLIAVAAMIISIMLRAQSPSQQITSWQYFFDTDPGVGIAGNGALIPAIPASTVNQTFSINLPGNLAVGFHTLYVRAGDEDGSWSIANRNSFYVIAQQATQPVDAIEYFIDLDPGPGNATAISVATGNSFSEDFIIMLPSLPAGFHQLFVRVKDTGGSWSVFERNSFYVVPDRAQKITAIQYYFDSDPGAGIAGNGEVISISPVNSLNQNLAINVPGTLSEGHHILYVRVKDEFGSWCYFERYVIVVGPCENGSSNDIISWWTFDNSTGTEVKDIVGNLDGIALNEAQIIGAAGLEGTDDYIGVPDNNAWAFGSNDFSIEFFAYFKNPGGDFIHPNDKFIGQGGISNQPRWTFALGSQLFFNVSDGFSSQNYAVSSFTPVIQQWYHLAFTREGDTLRTYIDGQQSGYQLVPGLIIPDVNSPLTIGYVDWGNSSFEAEFMNGYLDEMTIHSRALSEQEILDIAITNKGKCKSQVLEITTLSVSDAQYGVSFSQLFQSDFGVTPLTWTVVSGNLPSGISVDASGLLNGIPLESGEFIFTIKVEDATGAVDEKQFTMKVLLTLPEPTVNIYKSGTVAVPGREMDYFIWVENTGTSTAQIHVSEYLEAWFTYNSSEPPAIPLVYSPNIYTEAANDSIPALIDWQLNIPSSVNSLLTYNVTLQPTFPIGDEIVGTACAIPNSLWENVYQQQQNCMNEAKRYYELCIENCPGDPALAEICTTEVCKKIYNDYYNNCIPLSGDPFDCGRDFQYPQAPVDPNEKLVLAEKYIKPDQLLPYVIHFENIGTIEAQDVFITDTLDEDLDETSLDIISSTGASFNPTTRVLKWNLLDINLMPDSSEYVLYSAKPKPNLPSGAVIKNKAHIQFEVFDIFATNETENIIDLSNPEGVMDELPAIMLQTTFNISWSGSDTIGEIKDYSVFVSIDGGSYELFITKTKDTSALFTGEIGKTYSFICIAEDLAGNIEVQEPDAETSTHINVLCNSVFYFDADLDGYGNSEISSVSCSQPQGFIVDSTDCNETNSNINPGVTEACNFIDDNCNGQTDEGCPVTLNLDIFLQGFYSGNGLMDNAGSGGFMFVTAVSTTVTDVDTIKISAMDPVYPYSLVDEQKGILKTDGSVSVTFGPSVIAGNQYFIKVNHQNSAETWSSEPKKFSIMNNYLFNSAASKAYGGNLALTPDNLYYSIYTGDINQDGAVDGADFLELDPKIQGGEGGYNVGDINGDGAVDGADFLILDPNIQLGVGSTNP